MSVRRRSIAFQRRGDSMLERPNFYGHMFQEDVRLEAVPIGGQSRTRPEYEIKCDPTAPQDQRRLARFLREEEHLRYGLTRAVGEFIQSRAAYLVHYGEVHHELARNDEGEAILVDLPVGTIFDLRVCALQLVPRDAFYYDDEDHRRLALLPRSAYWHLRLPHRLAGPSGHRRLLDTLQGLSPVSPEWARPKIDDPYPSGFRSDIFHRRLQEEVAAATRKWAWPGRGFGSANDFAQLDRRLNFGVVITGLRNHIVRELNIVCVRVGLPQVTVSGLPTEAELRDLSNRMVQGTVTFAQVRDAIGW